MARRTGREVFAAWLDKRIDDLGLKTADVARAVDADGVQVMRWRRGEATPTPRYLTKLAQLFGADLEEMQRLAYLPDKQQLPASQELAAERQRWRSRYDYVMEQKVPRSMWDAYIAACEALAETFRHIHPAALSTDAHSSLSTPNGESDQGDPEGRTPDITPYWALRGLTQQSASGGLARLGSPA